MFFFLLFFFFWENSASMHFAGLTFIGFIFTQVIYHSNLYTTGPNTIILKLDRPFYSFFRLVGCPLNEKTKNQKKSKQGHLQPHFHSKARQLSTQL